MAILFGLVAAALFYTVFFTVKERIQVPPAKKHGMGKDALTIVKSPVWLLFFLMVFMTFGNMFVRISSTTYFAALRGIMMKENMSTKEKLMVAAIRLFAKKGLNNVSLDEILRESGVNKGSFYYYYETKEALLNDSLETLFHPIMEMRVEALAKAEGSFREIVDRFYRCMQMETKDLLGEMLGENDLSPSDIGFLLLEGIRCNDFARRSFQSNQTKIREVLKGRIEHEKRLGNLPRHMDADELATLVVTCGEGALYLSNWNSTLYENGTVLDICLKHIWRYIDTQSADNGEGDDNDG